MERPRYTIQGGPADAKRLARQASVMASATVAFLTRIGVQPGWSCLDVGCGTGQVTVELARLVGEHGRVVGTDIDADALDVARAAARAADVNVTFALADGIAPYERDAFDLAYSRLMLSHLLEPAAAVRAMAASVRPGGVVAVEDLFTGTLHADPPTAALDRLQEVYAATVRFHGGDPTIGPRLPAMLKAAGLASPQVNTVSNIMTTEDQKLFLVDLLRNMQAAIIETGACTSAEFEDLAAAVEAAARDERTVFYQARIHQVQASRNAPDLSRVLQDSASRSQEE